MSGEPISDERRISDAGIAEFRERIERRKDDDMWFVAVSLREADALLDDRADLLAEVDRLRSDLEAARAVDVVVDIPAQRAAGWPDFHPEDYCHRCGRPNLQSWFVASDLWNAAMRGPDGAVIEGYPPSEIVCPQCFSQADERLLDGGYRTWQLVSERKCPPLNAHTGDDA